MFGAVAKLQLIEQSLSLLQIARIEPLGKPAVDRSEKIAGLITLALINVDRRLRRVIRGSWYATW